MTPHQKFLIEAARMRERLRLEKFERLCTGNPTYTLAEVCLFVFY